MDCEQFREWCRRSGFGTKAQSVIENIRSSPPSRRVQSSRMNVSGRFPSRKMGVTVQFESHRVELAGIFEMEHDPNVLEFYDQPPPILLRYQSASGRQIGVMTTPDFFVIRQDSAGWEEWKTEEELLKLSHKQPNRFVKGPDGVWRCPPGQAYADQFGAYYRVRSDADIDWTLQRNLVFLQDYFRHDHPLVTEAVRGLVIDKVKKTPGITLAALMTEVGEASRDDIFALIALRGIFIDLTSAPLTNPDDVRVYLSAESAEGFRLAIPSPPLLFPEAAPVLLQAGSDIRWDEQEWRILNVGLHQITLLNRSNKVIELPRSAFDELVRGGSIKGTQRATPSMSEAAADALAKASPNDLRIANMRFHAIHGSSNPPSDEGHVFSARTLRHWKALFKQAQQEHGYGYVGLLPRTSSKGNRDPKIPKESASAMREVIEEHYLSSKNRNVKSVYTDLVRVCEARGIHTPCLATFYKEINRQSLHTRIRKRQGDRAAYRHEQFYWTLETTTPRHGDRPYEIGHIDHTELDIELVCSKTGKNLGRPWATLMADAFSRRILAVYLSFDPPSYRSCMMAIRLCVQRHGRLPQTLVVDGGPEFGSTYFETLLARYEITKKTRPGAKARFGSVVERLFGTSNTMFIHNLRGNTQVMRNVRQVTKNVNPKLLACWTLPALHEALCVWAYEVYDTLSHPALGQEPREAFAAALSAHGHRSHKLIPFDDSFKMLTMPSTRKGTARVQPGRGIKVNHLYYWPEASSVFLNPEVEGSTVPVRYDPFDCGKAYAYVQGRWIRCLSEHYKVFSGRTEREVQVATEELRKSLRNHSSESVTITARRLADFLASAQAEETLQLQRMRDTEAKHVLQVLKGVTPDRPVTSTLGEIVQLDHNRRPAKNDSQLAHQHANSLRLPADLKPYEEFD